MQQHPRDLAGSRLEQAKRDIDAARYLRVGGRFDAACFACRQAAEKALKAALTWLAGDRPRTHLLSSLIAEIVPLYDGVEAQLGDIVALDPYYVTTRYSDAIGGAVPGSTFFEPEALLALERAARAIVFAEAILAPPEPSA